ncbi:MAG: hypothetical protein U0359_30935 [Byssovorax sp.]
MKTSPRPWSTLVLRYGWFVMAFGVYAGRDACAGGGRRPDPPPAPSAAPASTAPAAPATTAKP